MTKPRSRPPPKVGEVVIKIIDESNWVSDGLSDVIFSNSKCTVGRSTEKLTKAYTFEFKNEPNYLSKCLRTPNVAGDEVWITCGNANDCFLQVVYTGTAVLGIPVRYVRG
jgi:hypothetical protein